MKLQSAAKDDEIPGASFVLMKSRKSRLFATQGLEETR